ncbi:MAG: amidohydrolase, partial [Ktedonobacterales bacterium]
MMFPGRRPILLLLNGDIHTMDPDKPRATALAVDRASGRIVAVGDDAEIRGLAGPLTDTLDLHGRVALPGFIDAHTHLLHTARARLNVDLRTTHSEDEAVALVRQRAERTPPGAWIVGQSWDKNQWTPQQFPTKAALDGATPDHPVALSSHDFHSLWVNSAALHRAGIDAQTPDPLAGRIERDASGEPTGMLFEGEAMALVERVITPADDETLRHELRQVLAELRARGVTGVHNIEDAHSLRLMQRLRDEGGLGLRLLLYIPRASLGEALRLGLTADFGDDWLRFAGIKVFMDGALGSQTAAMLGAYEGRPDNLGLLTTSEAEITQTVRAAADGGVGVAIHAIGDRAVKTALDGIETILHRRAQGGAPADALASVARRFRLEHVQLARPEDINRMAALGVIASVQPFHAVVDRYTAERYWGARYKRAYAYETMRRTGVRLALGSDMPVDTADPLRILHAAVARRNDETPNAPPWLPDQALSVADALRAYTVGAAYAGGQESRQGSLAPGKLADLVVLNDDPFTLPAERLAGAEVAA